MALEEYHPLIVQKTQLWRPDPHLYFRGGVLLRCIGVKQACHAFWLGCCALSLLRSFRGVCFEVVGLGPVISAFSLEQPMHNLKHLGWVMKGLIPKRCWVLQHIQKPDGVSLLPIPMAESRATFPMKVLITSCSDCAPQLTCSHGFPVQGHMKGTCKCLWTGTKVISSFAIPSCFTEGVSLWAIHINCSHHACPAIAACAVIETGDGWIKATCLLNTCKRISLSDTHTYKTRKKKETELRSIMSWQSMRKISIPDLPKFFHSGLNVQRGDWWNQVSILKEDDDLVAGH